MHAKSGRGRALARRTLRLGAGAALGALAWSVCPTACSGAGTAVKQPRTTTLHKLTEFMGGPLE